jgi:hypothetical protein
VPSTARTEIVPQPLRKTAQYIFSGVAFFRTTPFILSAGLDPVSYRVTHGLTLARAAPPFIRHNQSQA